MKKKKIRDTPEIVIPKGYGIDDLLDFDDEWYENGEPVLVEEVKVTFEREWNEKQRVWKINAAEETARRLGSCKPRKR